MSTETIDSTAVEIHDDHQAAAGTAVARRERRSEVIRPLSTQDLVESFSEYQAMLPRLLTAEDYQDAGRGKRFVKKSGWRKIATAFDLDVQLIRSVVERDEHGQPLRAEVWARAIAPSGRSMDGDGYCDVAEDRFSGPRGNKSKLENDLRATATTRAMNRAISGLVGMGAVSAEEVSAGDGHDAAPAWASPASNDSKKAMVTSLATVFTDDYTPTEFARALADRMGGNVPEVVAQWIIALPAYVAQSHARATGDPAREGDRS